MGTCFRPDSSNASKKNYQRGKEQAHKTTLLGRMCISISAKSNGVYAGIFFKANAAWAAASLAIGTR
ncbi:MAG: hypothetical protein ACK48P_07565, partial [Holosporales bacterium]